MTSSADPCVFFDGTHKGVRAATLALAFCIAALLAALVALVAVIFISMQSSIGEIKTAQIQTTKAISDFQIEVTKDIGDVRGDLRQTNTRLDDLLQELRKHPVPAMSKRKPRLFIDMPFNEALERFAGVDPAIRRAAGEQK